MIELDLNGYDRKRKKTNKTASPQHKEIIVEFLMNSLSKLMNEQSISLGNMHI